MADRAWFSGVLQAQILEREHQSKATARDIREIGLDRDCVLFSALVCCSSWVSGVHLVSFSLVEAPKCLHLNWKKPAIWEIFFSHIRLGKIFASQPRLADTNFYDTSFLCGVERGGALIFLSAWYLFWLTKLLVVGNQDDNAASLPSFPHTLCLGSVLLFRVCYLFSGLPDWFWSVFCLSCVLVVFASEDCIRLIGWDITVSLVE